MIHHHNTCITANQTELLAYDVVTVLVFQCHLQLLLIEPKQWHINQIAIKLTHSGQTVTAIEAPR